VREPLARHFLEALLTISKKLQDTEVVWAVTGSLGHALQGVPLEVHDIDLQTDEAGAYRIEECFRENIVRAVSYSSSERIRSHFGELKVGGVKVEVMGAVQKRLGGGAWEPSVDIAPHIAHVTVASKSIPVLNLRYEAQAYATLGRADRAKLLRRYIG